MFTPFARILDVALEVYMWLVFLAVIFSWLPLSPHHPAARKFLHFLHQATEPVFRFFRQTFRLQRYTAPLDLTPLLVILTIYFLRIFVVQTLYNLSPVGNFFQALFFTAHFILQMYFWVVLVAGVLLVIATFFPMHPLARQPMPLLANLTEPVFEWFRRLFESRLQVRVHPSFPALDVAPLVVLAGIYMLQHLLLSLAKAVF